MKIRLLTLFAAAFAIIGCSTDGKESGTTIEGEISLQASKSYIKCDGTDAVELKVIITDKNGNQQDVTSASEIYMSGNAAKMDSNLFSTDKEGEYEFYAFYGLKMAQNITVAALQDTPEIPADSQEGSTAFKHRILLIQHTGNECPNCPRMMTALKSLREDPAYNGLYSHVASHSYNDTDAAYSDAAKSVSSTFCSGFYPEATLNLTKTYQLGTDLSEIKTSIDELKKNQASASAAVAAEALGKKIFVEAEVKAGTENSFRVAAWLLEDDIYARQAGATESWFNYHENCLRAMYGTTPNNQIYGERIGTLKSGDKVQCTFTFTAEDNWKTENCKVLIIVTEQTEDGHYDVASTAVCKVGESVQHEYN